MNYFHIKEIEVPLYRGYLVIILSNDLEELDKKIENFGRDCVYAHALFQEWKKKSGFIFILNFHNDDRRIKHGVITHESIHIAHFIAQDRGFVPDFEHDEPIAYLAEWVTDEVYKFIEERGFSI